MSDDANAAYCSSMTQFEIYEAYARGKKYYPKHSLVEKMARGGIAFSWFTLLFGSTYYIYRKQYAIGLIWAAVETVLSIAAALAGSASLSYLIVNCALFLDQIILAFAFYPIYRASAHRVMQDCLNQHCWRDRSKAVLAERLRCEGGTNLAFALVVLAVQVILDGVFCTLWVLTQVYV